MAQTPKEEAEMLLNYVLPFAKQQLEKRKEFFPFGAAMLFDGKIHMVVTHDEQPNSQKKIDDLERIFIQKAKNRECKATALAFCSLFTDPKTKKKFDSVSVNLDHKDNYSVTVIYPYSIDQKNHVQFFAPTAMQGEKKIFKRT